MDKIKFTPDQIKFLEEYASVVSLSIGVEYFHMPFWFKKSEANDVLEVYHFHELPTELSDELDKERKIWADDAMQQLRTILRDGLSKKEE